MDRYIFIALTIIVLLFPMFFGGNVDWAWDGMAVLCGLCLTAWGIYLFKENKTIRYASRLKWIGILYSSVLLWILFQSFAPVTEIWTSPIRMEAETALGMTLPHVISLDPASSLTGLVRLVIYGIIFFLVLQTISYREDSHQAMMAFAISSVGYAIYGLYIHLTGANTILGVEREYYQDVLTSTFINRNSYATYAGFGLLAITAICLQKWLQLKASLSGDERHRFILTVSSFLSKYWWLVLAWTTVISALLLTGSRAGTISSLFAITFFIALYFVKRRLSFLKSLFALASFMIALGLLFTVSGDKITERITDLLAKEEISDERVQLYSQAMDVIRDYPWVGTGYETYSYVFYFYRDFEGLLPLRAVHAHSTYLENTLELGIPAALVFLAVFIVLLRVCYKGIKRRRRGFVLPAFGVSLTMLIAVHSLVDFSMEMPGIAATYAFLMALAVTQCWPARINAGKRPQS